MKITHVEGDIVETNNLPDVDAILMEESQKLFSLFKKYDRQLFLIGEMQGSEKQHPDRGCCFFHVMMFDSQDRPKIDEEKYKIKWNSYWSRINKYIQTMTGSLLSIKQAE